MRSIPLRSSKSRFRDLPLLRPSGVANLWNREDEAALAKGGLTRRQTYAIQARMGEKLVVKALKRLVIVGMMRTSEEAESEEDSGFTGDEAEEDEVDE